MLRKILCTLTLLSAGFAAEADNAFYVGPSWNTSRAKLKEVGTFTGNRWGVIGGYEYFKPWGFYANLQIEYTQGDLQDDVQNFSLDQRVAYGGGRIGAVFPYQILRFVPYTGYTYHWMHEKRNFTTATTNTFTYYLPFMPFGLMIHAQINEQWFVGINYQYQLNFDSYMAIASLVGSRWQLKTRDDQYVELEISYRPVETYSMRFVPFYHNFRIGPTTATTSFGLELGIPKQDYKTFGANLEFALHF